MNSILFVIVLIMFNQLLYIKKPLIKSKTDEIDTLNKLADTLFLNSNNINNKTEEIIDEEKNKVNDVKENIKENKERFFKRNKRIRKTKKMKKFKALKIIELI